MPESSHTPPASVTPGQWPFTRWKTIGQLEALVVHHPVFSATVFLQGAHLTHFVVNDDTNWLWLSDTARFERSEEHTSELQSRPHLVCRLLLEKKKHKLH